MNYKRKSRHRFFLLMQSRTPPISSEFRGGGGLNPPNPPSVRHCLRWVSTLQDICDPNLQHTVLLVISPIPFNNWTPTFGSLNSNAINNLLGQHWRPASRVWTTWKEHRALWRALVNAVMNLRVPWNDGNFLNGWKPISFSRRTLLHGISNLCPPR